MFCFCNFLSYGPTVVRTSRQHTFPKRLVPNRLASRWRTKSQLKTDGGQDKIVKGLSAHLVASRLTSKGRTDGCILLISKLVTYCGQEKLSTHFVPIT